MSRVTFRYLVPAVITLILVAYLSLFAGREAGSFEVVVLCYHHIVEREPENDCEIEIEVFEKQMRYLYENGYQPLSLTEFLEYYKNNSFPDNAVLLTFDDGYASFYKKAYPLLKKYQFPSVIFPIVSHIPGLAREIVFADKLTFNLMRFMDSESGLICVGSHSYDLHYYHDTKKPAVFPKPDESQDEYDCRIRKDLRTSRNILKLQTDMEIHALAWPYGASTERAEELAVDAGYEMIFTLEPEFFTKEDAITSIPRFAVDSSNMSEFKGIFEKETVE